MPNAEEINAQIVADLREDVVSRFERGARKGSLDGEGMEAGAGKMARAIGLKILAGVQLSKSLRDSRILALVEESLGRRGRFAEAEDAQPGAKPVVAEPTNGRKGKAAAQPVVPAAPAGQ